MEVVEDFESRTRLRETERCTNAACLKRRQTAREKYSGKGQRRGRGR